MSELAQEAQAERAAESKKEADLAAEAALKAWDPAKAHVAVCAAQGLTPIEAAAAQEGESVDRTAVLVSEQQEEQDRPNTAVAQLRELAEWLSRDGKDDVSGLAADLAESIAINYGVECKGGLGFIHADEAAALRDAVLGVAQ
jgi:hypothetical protein